MRRQISLLHVVAFLLLLAFAAGGAARATAKTASAGSCCGDCDDGGAVTIDEIVVAVDVALGASPLDACAAVDVDGSGNVSVDELLKAVFSAMQGCPTPTPTSADPSSTALASVTTTPTPSPTPTGSAAPTDKESATATPTATPTATGGSILVSTCSAPQLVAAIEAANHAAQAVIHLAAGCTYELERVDNQDPDFGTNGLPVIGADVTIEGNGSTVNGRGLARVFRVASGATLRLSDLTVHGGYAYGGAFAARAGGAIFNQGTTILTNVVVTGNSTADASIPTRAGDGGGIFNAGGTLTATDSAISRNSTGGRLGSFDVSGDGGAGGYGGGIYSSGGSVTLMRCTMEGNVTGNGHRYAAGGFEGGNGGAIANGSGTVTVIDSTIRDNTAGEGGQGGLGTTGGTGGDGGGIYNKGTLIVVGSTLSGNEAGRGGLGNSGPGGQTPTSGGRGGNGGGIANFSSLTVVDSTISGNSTGVAGQGYSTPAPDGEGGGIYDQGSSDLRSATIAGNTARQGHGGGVAAVSNVLRAANSMFAGNTAGDSPDCASGFDGMLISGGHNLIGRADGCDWAAGEGDQVGTPESPVDPGLGPLLDNGGPTSTRALSAASPAVDGGDPAGCAGASGALLANDQRGEPRVRDGDGDGEAVCDIGAFELQSPSK